MNRSLNSFSDCIKAITKADEEIALLQEVCRICVEVGGHRMAWIAFAENDPHKTLRPVTHWGEKGCFLECLNATWSNTERGQGPAGTCVRTGEPVVFQNLMESRRYKPWQEAAKQCNFSSCIALPLKNDQQTLGALVIFNALPNAFDRSEIRLLTELATDLSYGIKNLRLKVERSLEGDERLMMATVTDQTSDGVITFDCSGTIQYMNPSFIDLCGIPAHQGVGVSIHNFECSQRNHTFYQAVLEVFRTNKVKKGQFINKKKDGSEYEIDARISPVFNQSHQVVRYVATIRDISHESKLTQQLRQAQKMEAVATLSGGIAHDFKNILGTIMTDSELALEQNPQDDQQQRLMLSIYKAALRGKGLIHKFMEISRQHEQPKQRMSMKEIVRDSMKLLTATFPTTIQIKTNISKDIAQINGDPEQIQQVIMNICTNAKDAMQGSGHILEVSLSNTVVPVERQGLNPDLHPGKYVMMTITDTGHSLEREQLDRIFDPFYKIKGQRESSGLGLALAHGIVKNHGGHITVNSISGVGTTFVALFPQAEEVDHKGVNLVEKTSHGRILLIGAEQEYIAEMRSALHDLGYLVQAEIEGRETLE
ncbi:MAG: GAF domain-containing protein, partial [Deltaproteobacteria bacterium]|nr:GAF domain-containing protein [Deltaproteobacteria bacterium]